MTVGATGPNHTIAADKPQAPGRDSPAKVRDAAQQFEALLISQMLSSVRANGGLEKTDAAGDSALGYAEQQLGMSLARSGGLGLADLIAKGLEKAR